MYEITIGGIRRIEELQQWPFLLLYKITKRIGRIHIANARQMRCDNNTVTTRIQNPSYDNTK